MLADQKMVNMFAENECVKIHYVNKEETGATSDPIVIIPGLAESAEDYLSLVPKIKNRTVIVISLRGRGQSDAPLQGYSLEDHVRDIETVIIEELKLDSFYLFGYSRGVSYMLAFGLAHSEKVSGIIIGDYPAIHTKLPEQWVDFFIGLPPWRGKTALERMPKHALEGIQRESSEKIMWEQLSSFTCPVMVIGGGKKGSLLSEEHMQLYKNHLLDVQLNVLEDSDHNLFFPEEEKLVRLINNFLDMV